MTKLTVTFLFDDSELDQAISFLGANEETVPLVRRDFFINDTEIDFRVIEEAQKRYYHTNGVVAMLTTLQEEIYKIKQKDSNGTRN